MSSCQLCLTDTHSHSHRHTHVFPLFYPLALSPRGWITDRGKRTHQIIPHHMAWMWQMEEVGPLPITMLKFSAWAAHSSWHQASMHGLLGFRGTEVHVRYRPNNTGWWKDKHITATDNTLKQRDWNQGTEREKERGLGSGDRLGAHSLTEAWN